MNKVKILPCRSGRVFAGRISEHLTEKYGWQEVLGKVNVREFKNREVNPTVEESVRGSSVYVVQNVDDPDSGRSPQENFDELLELTDAARRSVLYGHVSVIMPNYYKARQHASKKRESLAARLTADQLEAAGAEAVVSIDIHNEGIHGYFTRVKFDNLHASRYIINFLRDNFPDFINYKIMEDSREVCGFSVGSPDVGGAKRAEYFSKKLKCRLIIGAKFRDESKPNEDSLEKVIMLGDVKGRNILQIDDMIDTGGSMVGTSYELKRSGANDIYLACTHPIFSGPAIERLTKLYNEGIIKGVIGTDTVSHMNKGDWYHEVSVAPLFGDFIYRVENNMFTTDLHKESFD